MTENQLTDERFTVENVGPIEGLFDLGLDGPGLYELQGGKGKGKSTILSCLAVLSGCKTALTVNDSEPEGEISGFGATVPVGSRRKKVGKLEASVLDAEKFDLVDLIDPSGKTPVTRDAVRIKALATLSGLTLQPEDFHEICGGRMAYEDMGIQATSDPVLMTQRVKDKIDSQAKLYESQASVETGYAKGFSDQTEGLDLGQECDPDKLNGKVIDSANELTKLSEQKAAYEASVDQRREAEQRLDVHRESSPAASREEIEKQISLVKSEQEQSLSDLDKISIELGIIQETFRVQKERCQQTSDKAVNLEEKLNIVVAHEKLIAKYEAELKKETSVPVDEATIEAAETCLNEARLAQEQGVRVRDALRSQEKAKQHGDHAKGLMKKAGEHRANAKSVFDIITKKMDTKHIRIKNIKGNPRLVVDHERGKNTLFDQDDGLSDGERVLISISELLPRLPSPGVFPVPQRTYQDLPPADRKELAEYAQTHGLYVFGAQVTNGELSVSKV